MLCMRRFLFLLITLLLSGCNSVDYYLSQSKNAIHALDNSSILEIHSAENLAVKKNNQADLEKVQIAYVDSYVELMTLADAKSTSANNELGKAGALEYKLLKYQGWSPDIKRMMDSAPSYITARIPNKYRLENIHPDKLALETSDILYKLGMASNDKSKKLFYLVASLNYNSERPGINKKIENAYLAASSRIVIHNNGDKKYNGEILNNQYVIPEIIKNINDSNRTSLKSILEMKEGISNVMSGDITTWPIITAGTQRISGGNNIDLYVKVINAAEDRVTSNSTEAVEHTKQVRRCPDSKKDSHKDHKKDKDECYYEDVKFDTYNQVTTQSQRGSVDTVISLKGGGKTYLTNSANKYYYDTSMSISVSRRGKESVQGELVSNPVDLAAVVAGREIATVVRSQVGY